MAVRLSARPAPSPPVPIAALRRSDRLRSPKSTTDQAVQHKQISQNPRKRRRDPDCHPPIQSPLQQSSTPTQSPRSIRALKRQKLSPQLLSLDSQLPLRHTQNPTLHGAHNERQAGDLDFPVSLRKRPCRKTKSCLAVGCDTPTDKGVSKALPFKPLNPLSPPSSITPLIGVVAQQPTNDIPAPKPEEFTPAPVSTPIRASSAAPSPSQPQLIPQGGLSGLSNSNLVPSHLRSATLPIRPPSMSRVPSPPPTTRKPLASHPRPHVHSPLSRSTTILHDDAPSLPSGPLPPSSYPSARLRHQPSPTGTLGPAPLNDTTPNSPLHTNPFPDPVLHQQPTQLQCLSETELQQSWETLQPQDHLRSLYQEQFQPHSQPPPPPPPHSRPQTHVPWWDDADLKNEYRVWRVACKVRVSEIHRLYTADTIRAVVAQQASDYWSQYGWGFVDQQDYQRKHSKNCGNESDHGSENESDSDSDSDDESDEDHQGAEGQMEVDLEPFSDPSFNADLTSHTNASAVLSPPDTNTNSALLSAFYVPPSPPPTSLTQTQTATQMPYRTSVPLPLPPPRLGSIPVLLLKYRELGIDMLRQGTPISRKRRAEWGTGVADSIRCTGNDMENEETMGLESDSSIRLESGMLERKGRPTQTVRNEDRNWDGYHERQDEGPVLLHLPPQAPAGIHLSVPTQIQSHVQCLPLRAHVSQDGGLVDEVMRGMEQELVREMAQEIAHGKGMEHDNHFELGMMGQEDKAGEKADLDVGAAFAPDPANWEAFLASLVGESQGDTVQEQGEFSMCINENPDSGLSQVRSARLVQGGADRDHECTSGDVGELTMLEMGIGVGNWFGPNQEGLGMEIDMEMGTGQGQPQVGEIPAGPAGSGEGFEPSSSTLSFALG